MGTVSYFVKKGSKTSTGKEADFVTRLVNTHGVQLRRFLTRMIGSPEIAAEVAQETFLKLHRFCRPEEVECAPALLFDVATKLAITRLKRQRAEKELLEATADNLGEVEEVADESPRPDRRAMADQALQGLTVVVERLSPTLREVFVMRYVRQMPRHEIASHLGITVGAVEQRLTRALAECRRRLAALGIDWLGLD